MHAAVVLNIFVTLREREREGFGIVVLGLFCVKFNQICHLSCITANFYADSLIFCEMYYTDALEFFFP